jgi:hypothetical protein
MLLLLFFGRLTWLAHSFLLLSLVVFGILPNLTRSLAARPILPVITRLCSIVDDMDEDQAATVFEQAQMVCTFMSTFVK